MSDDQPFYAPNRAAAPPRQSQAGERVWEVRGTHVTWSGEFRFHGESYGWEVQILSEGELVTGQRFALRRVAAAWAEAERQILETGGPVIAEKGGTC